jgi:UDP-N-acetyl-D-mannosaminuronic acid dehydrogenase
MRQGASLPKCWRLWDNLQIMVKGTTPKYKHVCVLGLGYIGLPIASTLATCGIRVTGMDVNPIIVTKLQKGELHIYEPGLKTLVEQALSSGMLTVTDRVVPADAFIIAVPTPILPDKRADLEAVRAASASLVPHLKNGNLVMLESTSPPRTTVDIVAPILEESGLKAGDDFLLAYTPERVLPGKIIQELVTNPRVIGGVNDVSTRAGVALYKTFVKGEIIQTDATTAEMVKLMENTTRDVNIAIANEFARLADKLGVDVWEAISIANRHPRINILRPGPGVGGHCISVDPWFLVEAAPEITPLIRTAREVNDQQPNYTFQMIEQKLGSLIGKHVAVLGLAFKPNVDDLRESPAIEIARLILEGGATVTAFEPFKPDLELDEIEQANSLQEVLAGADLLVLLVAHDQFCSLDPEVVAGMMPGRLAVDTVGCWQPSAWKQAGFTLARLGVGKAS